MKIAFAIFFFFVVMATFSEAAIEIKSSLPWMKNLGATAECVIKDQGFQKEVSAIEKFDYSTKNGKQVVADLLTFKNITLSTYKTKSPWSKTIAYRPVGKAEVYFNLRKNPRDFSEMINTTIHEWLHVYGYGHGDNSSKGKGKSVPYWIGDIAEKYVLNCSKGFGI